MDEYRKYEPIFGSWYLSRLIGKGSFGKVYEIVREEFGVTYRSALKIITVPQDDEDIRTLTAEGMSAAAIKEYYNDLLRDFVNENEIMSKLKGNSNIVSYEDHQIIPHEDGIGYDILIRMELLTPLLDRMMEKRLDEKEVVKLGIDMCKALGLCHRKNIIHRDIKPQNIFISDSGDYKLGDFGIARTMEKTTGGMSKKGTYKYMAPEVFRGEHYDSTVDLYSLGIVLYSLLNGNRGPFLPPPPAKVTANEEEEARMRRFRGEPIPSPRDAGVMLSYIIKKACSADPAKRYRTAEQMGRDLENYLANYDELSVVMPAGMDAERTEVDYDSRRYTGSVPPITATRVTGSIPPVAPNRMTGSYENPAYGGQYGAQAPYGTQNTYGGGYGMQGGGPVQPREVKSGGGKGLKIAVIVLAVLVLAGGIGFALTKILGGHGDSGGGDGPSDPPVSDDGGSGDGGGDTDPDDPDPGREPENILPAKAQASSELAPNTNAGTNYYASNAIDQDYSTAWVEGANGTGTGETITVWFNNKYPIEVIYIANGYQKSDEVFWDNNRVKEVILTFDDGSKERCTLKDVNEDQIIVLSRPIDSHSVTIEIVSVYKGDADDKDTCITEIMLEDPEYIDSYANIVYSSPY